MNVCNMNWLLLSDNLWHIILNFLGPRDLFNSFNVCHELRKIINVGEKYEAIQYAKFYNLIKDIFCKINQEKCKFDINTFTYENRPYIINNNIINPHIDIHAHTYFGLYHDIYGNIINKISSADKSKEIIIKKYGLCVSEKYKDMFIYKNNIKTRKCKFDKLKFREDCVNIYPIMKNINFECNKKNILTNGEQFIFISEDNTNLLVVSPNNLDNLKFDIEKIFKKKSLDVKECTMTLIENENIIFINKFQIIIYNYCKNEITNIFELELDDVSTGIHICDYKYPYITLYKYIINAGHVYVHKLFIINIKKNIITSNKSNEGKCMGLISFGKNCYYITFKIIHNVIMYSDGNIKRFYDDSFNVIYDLHVDKFNKYKISNIDIGEKLFMCMRDRLRRLHTKIYILSKN